jgi:hypothetical protein
VLVLFVSEAETAPAEADPRTRATWIFDNTDLERPSLSKRDGREHDSPAHAP